MWLTCTLYSTPLPLPLYSHVPQPLPLFQWYTQKWVSVYNNIKKQVQPKDKVSSSETILPCMTEIISCVIVSIIRPKMFNTQTSNIHFIKECYLSPLFLSCASALSFLRCSSRRSCLRRNVLAYGFNRSITFRFLSGFFFCENRLGFGL